jgi:tRNA C32,U32 (ribose-2'-O)-methylase TrmJ
MNPVIVLIRPQLGENIGKTARAMLNFGLTELRLVSPRDGWPNPQAGPAAAGADVVIANAQVFDTVAAAVADCRFASAALPNRLLPQRLLQSRSMPRPTDPRSCSVLSVQGSKPMTWRSHARY